MFANHLFVLAKFSHLNHFRYDCETTFLSHSSKLRRVRIQLRRPALRGHQGLQQIGRLSAGRLLRGQPIPEQLERRVRGGRVAIRSV